ncbi:acyltransferase family protein [Cohnella thermotolerans]|uniref:acyltransferase family protein n=1 Tax=Cohnella thermotolerans TaxID=329858 RepID=UPI00047E0C36|nr:acyltransferase family protein [Cohnella thermotolerans]
MQIHTRRKSRYMPGLDGLRALSVLAVIAYHLDLPWAPGGYLGVGVFFVLSGYLITDQLVAKWQRDRRLDLKSFWLRRARRLLPAMLLMIVAVSAWLAAADPSRLRSLGGDVLSAVTYVNNWWLIYHKVSYFESFGPPSPFGHFWSLAVEEQFYLLWPLLLIVGLKFVPQRGKLAGLMIAGAAASAIAMALLYSPDADPSRVYYGTDTRVFGLLIGAALAVVWPSAKLPEDVRPRVRIGLDIAGAVALALVLYMMGSMQEYDAFPYRGGLALLSLAAALLVACLAHPASRLARLLAAKPLRWLGVRSYGIYLWHFPVIALTSPAVDTDGVNGLRAALQVGASLALAALSWKFVEEPILRGLWKKRLASLLARFKNKEAIRKQVAAVMTAGMAFILCVSCVGTGPVGEANAVSSGNDAAASQPPVDASQPETNPDPTGTPSKAVAYKPPASGATTATGTAKPLPPAKPGAGKPGASSNAGQTTGSGSGSQGNKQTAGGGAVGNGKGSGNGQTAGSQQPSGKDSAGGAGQTNAGGSKNGGSSASAGDGANAGAPDAAPQSGKGITVIGDSVILGVKPYLEKLLPGIVVDGEVGRQLSAAHEAVDAHSAAGDLGDLVILELGTNGSFSKKKLTALLDSLGPDRRILLVNTRVPRKWQDSVNDMLKEAASDYDNATLVDWYASSEGKDEYFGEDGVHLTRTGAEFYAGMLAEAIGKA